MRQQPTVNAFEGAQAHEPRAAGSFKKSQQHTVNGDVGGSSKQHAGGWVCSQEPEDGGDQNGGLATAEWAVDDAQRGWASGALRNARGPMAWVVGTCSVNAAIAYMLLINTAESMHITAAVLIIIIVIMCI